MKRMKHSEIEELIDTRKDARTKLADIKRVDENTLKINGHLYNLIVNKNDGFELGQFENTFNPIFTHFDYIVGDIGYGQLRLKGFYDDQRNVESDLKKSSIQDYLIDYCNFGSSYFVLHNLEASKVKENKKPITRPRNRNHQKSNIQKNHENKPKRQPQKQTKPNRHRKFTIRQKSGD
ncbi:YutD family protein [Fructilactobacillus sanfranciscensis]|uniref:YutD family protein n=2 Tax=Fructilactobacillus sanfranciscensis TaxID=1625 RepID=UPI00384ECC13